MKKILLFVFIISINTIHAQIIVGNNALTPAEYIQNYLLGSGITVTNIKFNGSTTAANTIVDQIGKFSNGTASVGITNGIILSTGNSMVAEGPNDLSGASLAPASPITGDPDLALLTTSTVRNTASIEFDFVPIGQNLSFNFVFASEEYLEFVNSNYNDVFGFFISGPGITGPFSGNAKNLAVLPSTNTPITINTINNVLNSDFYINNGTGSTPNVNFGSQYDGHTKVLPATTTVQCGETYHIKLAIANVSDNAFDSAVFIEANSFNANQLVNLPNDFLVSNGSAPCYGTTQQICTGLSNSILHQWSLNGVAIPNVTGSCVPINQSGQLCVTVYPMGISCPTTQCINVEFAAPMIITNPTNLTACQGSTYNLTSNTPVILTGLIANGYAVTYYHNQTDAQNLTNPITNNTNYVGTNGEVIWAGVKKISTGCVETRSFVLTTDTVNTTVAPLFNTYGPYYQNATPDSLSTVSNNGITGTWSPSSISTTSLGTQTYTFIPNAGQCAGVTTIDVTVEALASDQFSNLNFSVFPNPAREQLTVQLSGTATVKQIRLIDMLGRTIKTENYNSANAIETLNLKEVAKGSYFVEVTSDSNQKEIKKIIVN
jgi:hypothetical protein